MRYGFAEPSVSKKTTGNTTPFLNSLNSAEQAHNQGVKMKKAFLFAIIASAIYVAGCAMTEPRAGWVKPGVSQYDAENAYAQCEYDVSMQKLETPAEKDKTVKNCMIRQGFRYGYYE